ncbi:glycine zipper 2TM domain-containing protein [Curvibacter gracilis]|uniref:glycine zipper 2TM domain-containing protein n=1 Tax=Curvibacter gracilis TaxID=230310 RepID=UPI000487BFA2|nr:glycine zipper 2TM domain-containing protein [Curvibacter gracilis]
MRPSFLHSFLLSAVALAMASSVQAQAPADTQQAKNRYKQDLQICASETSADSRMQCKRDAKTEYDQALANLKASQPVTAPEHAGPAGCADCGTVSSVSQIEREGEGSALGLIAGGVAGAVLGHQVGGGFGKDLATVAGAAGGAYAGREVEKKVKSHKIWVVTVRFNGNSSQRYEFQNDPGFKVGDAVKKSNKSIVRP